MMPERKSTMISARVPAAVVVRLDFVVRNTSSEKVRSRSAALLDAVEEWLTSREKELTDLGIIPKKAAR